MQSCDREEDDPHSLSLLVGTSLASMCNVSVNNKQFLWGAELNSDWTTLIYKVAMT